MGFQNTFAVTTARSLSAICLDDFVAATGFGIDALNLASLSRTVILSVLIAATVKIFLTCMHSKTFVRYGI